MKQVPLVQLQSIEWMDIKIYRERKREKKLDLHKCILVLSESFGLVRSKSIVFTSYLSAVSHLGYRISISLCTGQDNKFYFSYFIFIFIRCVYCLWYATHTHTHFIRSFASTYSHFENLEISIHGITKINSISFRKQPNPRRQTLDAFDFWFWVENAIKRNELILSKNECMSFHRLILKLHPIGSWLWRNRWLWFLHSLHSTYGERFNSILMCRIKIKWWIYWINQINQIHKSRDFRSEFIKQPKSISKYSLFFHISSGNLKLCVFFSSSNFLNIYTKIRYEFWFKMFDLTRLLF